MAALLCLMFPDSTVCKDVTQCQVQIILHHISWPWDTLTQPLISDINASASFITSAADETTTAHTKNQADLQVCYMEYISK